MLKESPNLFNQPIEYLNAEEFNNDCERIKNTLMSGQSKTYQELGVNSRRMTTLKRDGFKCSFEKVKRGKKWVYLWYCSPSDIEHNLKNELILKNKI